MEVSEIRIVVNVLVTIMFVLLVVIIGFVVVQGFMEKRNVPPVNQLQVDQTSSGSNSPNIVGNDNTVDVRTKHD